MKTKETVTVREAVRLAQVTRQQVYNLIVNGSIETEKVNGKYMIVRKSLDQYIAQRDQKARS
jgi:excisionase family DNA binding protein